MIQILDKNDDLAGILQNDSSAAAAYWDDEVHEKLNDVYITLKFKMNADHEAAEYVVHGSKAIIQDLDGDLQIFEIKTVEDYQDSEGHRIKDVYAEHIALELNGRIIRPGEYQDYNAQQFLEMVLEGTRWKVGIVEWLGLHDIILDEYTSGIKAIIKAASEFDGEFKFRVEMEHGRISNVYVDLLQRRGENTGVQVLYGHNQESLKRLEDSSEVYTALIGVAKGSEGGYLTFEDVVAEDKPAGQDWIGNDEALQKYGILMPNGERMHYMGVYTYGGTNEDLTPEELLTFTRRQLTMWSKPKFTYEANVIDLEAISNYSHEKMRLGDTIVINNDDFNPAILMEARIIEFNWSNSDPSKNKVVLGDYRDIWDQNLFNQIQSLRNTIISNAGQWESGGTAVIRSTTAPTDTSAVWIDISTSPNVVKSFNPDTGLWEKASPTVPGEIGAITDSEAQAIAEKEANEAEAAAKSYAEQQASAAQAAAEDVAAAEAAAAEARAKAYADGIITPEEQAVLDNFDQEIADARTYAEQQAAAAESAAKEASEIKMHVGTTAPADTSRKWLDTSNSLYVLKVYSDGVWKKATPTTAAEVGAETPSGAQSKADAAKNAAISAAAADAKAKADAAQAAAEAVARAEGDLAETNAKAYADGVVDAEEQARINQAAANLQAAKDDATAKANAAEIAAKNYAAQVAKSEAATAKSEAIAYAEKKIYRGSAVPTGAVSGDLWIDESVTGFPVYRKFDGTNWNLMTTWSLADLIGQITGNQIEDGSITPIKIEYLNADLIDVGSLTGITVDVTNAGMTAQDVVAEAVRLWAGTTWSNRYNAPFRVLQNGKVIASNIDILGGSIDVANDIKVGNSIFLGEEGSNEVKGIVFNIGSDILSDGTRTSINATNFRIGNNIANIETTDGSMVITATYTTFATPVSFRNYANFDMDINAYGKINVHDQIIMNGFEPISTVIEAGYCGTGGMTTGITSAVSGVGVNYRTKKNYTPSSVSLASSANNLVSSTHVHAIDISANGFWLYIDGGSTANAYRYWRGTYQA